MNKCQDTKTLDTEALDTETLDTEALERLDDTVVMSVINKFTQRSLLGKQKYGNTLDRNDLSTSDWITHAQEELMDGILYLERLKRNINE